MSSKPPRKVPEDLSADDTIDASETLLPDTPGKRIVEAIIAEKDTVASWGEYDDSHHEYGDTFPGP